MCSPTPYSRQRSAATMASPTLTKPKTKSRTVRFDGTVCVVPITTHREYSREEHSATWYAKPEYRSFRMLEMKRRRRRRRQSNLQLPLLAKETSTTTMEPTGNSDPQQKLQRQHRSFLCHDRWEASSREAGSCGILESHPPVGGSSRNNALERRNQNFHHHQHHKSYSQSFPSLPVRAIDC